MKTVTIPGSKNDQYYKMDKKRQEWLGVRYFRFNPNCDKVIQVCVGVGETKRGKSNTFGIYLIERLTFFTNYLAMGYAVPCTKKEYDNYFDKVLKLLK